MATGHCGLNGELALNSVVVAFMKGNETVAIQNHNMEVNRALVKEQNRRLATLTIAQLTVVGHNGVYGENVQNPVVVDAHIVSAVAPTPYQNTEENDVQVHQFKQNNVEHNTVQSLVTGAHSLHIRNAASLAVQVSKSATGIAIVLPLNTVDQVVVDQEKGRDCVTLIPVQ